MRSLRDALTGVGTAALLSLAAALAVAGCSTAGRGSAEPPVADAGNAAGVRYTDQGPEWTAATRASFYSMDQGSEIMPLAWARAITTADGRPFLGDGLARYGYLPNGTSALPVGFTSAVRQGTSFLGMTCAACHTRQIEVEGTAYRVDGGPALSDFQSFLADLDQAMGRVATDDARFAAFADAVLGAGATPAARTRLKDQVDAWYRRQHTLFSRALPTKPWGVGRLDAVSMIFNRVSGLDIGTAPDWIIENNIYSADAPVRYPFIWDAPRQDRTQWPGFANNGDVILAIARNLGEVYGVFADFHPVKESGLLGYDYLSRNSANFEGLGRLESLVRRIGPPAWPWPVDRAAAARGQQQFEGACASCHGIREGALRLFPVSRTWKTPLVDVGTDTRQYDVLARTADTGVMKGSLAGLNKRLGDRDRQFRILSATVIGTMVDRFAHKGLPAAALVRPIRLRGLSPSALPRITPQEELAGLYHTEVADQAATTGSHVYEARVLRGIWATAPYLHNGSVASLAELLKRPEERMASFAMGPRYDRATVGIAAVQSGPPRERRTTGCDDLNSGDSRCGHVYGTDMTAANKRDLLEYLKTL